MQKLGADIARAALRELGVLALGKPGEAENIDDACLAGSEMLDRWRLDRLFIRGDTRTVHTAGVGVASYTIGPGGAFNQDLPEEIERWGVIVDVTAAKPVEWPRGRVLTTEEWARVVIKNTDGALPDYLWFDRVYTTGLGNIAIDPVPNVANVGIVLYQRLPQITSLVATTTYDLAEGMIDAIQLNLACKLANRYGVKISQDLPDLKPDADAALGEVRRSNIQPEESPRRSEFSQIGQKTTNGSTGTNRLRTVG